MSDAMLSQDVLHAGDVVLRIHRPKRVDLTSSCFQNPWQGNTLHIARIGMACSCAIGTYATYAQVMLKAQVYIEEFQFLIFLRLCARKKYRKMHCQASLGVSNVKISSLVTLQLIAEQCFLQHLHFLQRSA